MIPGGLVAETCEFAVEVGEVLLDVVKGGKVLTQTQSFSGREVKVKPPGAVVSGEGVTARQFNLLAMKDAVKTILDGGALFDERAPMSQQGAEFADVAGWDPHFGDKIGGEEFGEADGIMFVGFDGGVCDPLDLECVGDDDALDERGDEVVEPPGVAGSFEDDDIGGVEMGGRPSRELVEVNAARGWQDEALLGVDGGDDGKMFVQVNADEARDGKVVHCKPPKSKIGLGADTCTCGYASAGVGGRRFNYRCGLSAERLSQMRECDGEPNNTSGLGR